MHSLIEDLFCSLKNIYGIDIINSGRQYKFDYLITVASKNKQEAVEKCWAHSPLQAAVRRLL